LPKEATVHHQDMAVEVESQEVAKGLDGDDGARDGIKVDLETLKQQSLGWPKV